jgi:RHS repeat-associated protein
VSFFFDQQFDELGRILATTGAQLQVWNFTHDVEDNLNLVTDPLANTVASGFDPLNRLNQITDELSEVTTLEHDENDAVTSYTDPRGLETTTDYNGFGEVISEVSPDRGTMTYTYNSRGLVESMVDARGIVTTYSYDDDGRLTARGDSGVPIDTPAPLQADYAYNADTGAEYFAGSPQVNDLNTAAEENQVSVQKGATKYWDIGFADAAPGLGTPTQVLLTLQYRPTNGWQGTFRAEYRVGAAVLATVDLPASAGQLGQYIWDLTAAVQSVADLNGGTLRVLNLTTQNKAVRVSRSVLDTIQTAPGVPTGGESFVWGTAGLDAGKLTLITDESGTTARSHDARGRIAAETRVIGGVGFDIDYGYDDEDLLTLVTYPSGRQVQYLRDAAGQVTAVQQRPDAASAWEDVATGITWRPFGDLDQMTRGNGTVYTALYDQSYRMTGQSDLGGTTLRDVAYGYSLRDNLTSADDLLNPAEDVTYGYDPRQMLESASGPWGALGFTYDPAGNRASRSLTPAGGPASVDAYAYAVDSNRLTAIANPLAGTRSYSHDAAGNTTAELRALGLPDAWAYDYDKAGRLASVAVDGAAQGAYLYNALGQQVHRTAWPGPLEAVTLSVHDLNGNRLAEHADTGAVIREYIWLDGRPLAVIEGGQTYWLHWDHILRPVMATSSTGAVVWAARYLPFGGIDQVLVDTGVLTQNIRFPGQWFQAETGLHQNGMRDYDPTTGRYLQADPLGLVDGASVYGYARQSPVRWTDPTGLYVFPQGCAGGPVTCVGSAVVEMIIVGAIILNAPDVPDFGKSNCDDDCARLYQDVETRVNRLKKRYYDYLEDKLGLPEEGPYPPGGRRGHRNAFENDQSGLRNKLTEADSKGCRNYASDAWLWATRRI